MSLWKWSGTLPVDPLALLGHDQCRLAHHLFELFFPGAVFFLHVRGWKLASGVSGLTSIW